MCKWWLKQRDYRPLQREKSKTRTHPTSWWSGGCFPNMLLGTPLVILIISRLCDQDPLPHCCCPDSGRFSHSGELNTSPPSASLSCPALSSSTYLAPRVRGPFLLDTRPHGPLFITDSSFLLTQVSNAPEEPGTSQAWCRKGSHSVRRQRFSPRSWCCSER